MTKKRKIRAARPITTKNSSPWKEITPPLGAETETPGIWRGVLSGKDVNILEDDRKDAAQGDFRWCRVFAASWVVNLLLRWDELRRHIPGSANRSDEELMTKETFKWIGDLFMGGLLDTGTVQLYAYLIVPQIGADGGVVIEIHDAAAHVQITGFFGMGRLDSSGNLSATSTVAVEIVAGSRKKALSHQGVTGIAEVLSIKPDEINKYITKVEKDPATNYQTPRPTVRILDVIASLEEGNAEAAKTIATAKKKIETFTAKTARAEKTHKEKIGRLQKAIETKAFELKLAREAAKQRDQINKEKASKGTTRVAAEPKEGSKKRDPGQAKTIAALNEKISKLSVRANRAEADLIHLQTELDDTIDANGALSSTIASLTKSPPETQESRLDEPTPAEEITTTNHLTEWLRTGAADHIVVSPKAIRATKKLASPDIPFITGVLRAMNDWYWPMKATGDQEAKAAWDKFLASNRLRYGPTGMATDIAKLSETYHTRVNGTKYPLDMHIQGKSGRRREEGFRIYFHFDDENQRIIVGHFPTHLPNAMT